MMAGQLGIHKEVRWARVGIMAFGFWAISTSFVCFEKPDFLNLTLAIVGLFLLLDPQ